MATTISGKIAEKYSEVAINQVLESVHSILKKQLQFDKVEEEMKKDREIVQAQDTEEQQSQANQNHQHQSLDKKVLQSLGIASTGAYFVVSNAYNGTTKIYKSALSKAVSATLGEVLDKAQTETTDAIKFTVGNMLLGKLIHADQELVAAAAETSITQDENIAKAGLPEVLSGLHEGLHEWATLSLQQAEKTGDEKTRALCNAYLSGDKFVDRILLLSNVADHGIGDEVLNKYKHLETDGLKERLGAYANIVESCTGGNTKSLTESITQFIKGQDKSIGELAKDLAKPLSNVLLAAPRAGLKVAKDFATVQLMTGFVGTTFNVINHIKGEQTDPIVARDAYYVADRLYATWKDFGITKTVQDPGITKDSPLGQRFKSFVHNFPKNIATYAKNTAIRTVKLVPNTGFVLAHKVELSYLGEVCKQNNMPLIKYKKDQIFTMDSELRLKKGPLKWETRKISESELADLTYLDHELNTMQNCIHSLVHRTTEKLIQAEAVARKEQFLGRKLSPTERRKIEKDVLKDRKNDIKEARVNYANRFMCRKEHVIQLGYEQLLNKLIELSRNEQVTNLRLDPIKEITKARLAPNLTVIASKEGYQFIDDNKNTVNLNDLFQQTDINGTPVLPSATRTIIKDLVMNEIQMGNKFQQNDWVVKHDDVLAEPEYHVCWENSKDEKMKALKIKEYDFSLRKDECTARYYVDITKVRGHKTVVSVPAENLFSEKRVPANAKQEDLSIVKCSSLIKAIDAKIVKPDDLIQSRAQILKNGKVSINHQDINGDKYMVDLLYQRVSKGTQAYSYPSLSVDIMLGQEQSRMDNEQREPIQDRNLARDAVTR